MNDRQQTFPEEREPGIPAQQAFILCSSQRPALLALVDEIEAVFVKRGEQPRLLYGVTPTRREGFIVIQATPATSLALQDASDLLKTHESVLDCVIHEVTDQGWLYCSDEPETIADPAYQQEAEPLTPPALPAGYVPRGKPEPLLSSHDSYWMVPAWGQIGGTGILVYAQNHYQAFFNAEEAVSLLAALLRQVPDDLLPRCSLEYLSLHAHSVALIRAYLYALQLEIFRRGYQYAQQRRGRPVPQDQDDPASLKMLFQWLDEHRLRIVADDETLTFRLVPDAEINPQEARGE